ncbi:MAG: hypothetical protein WD552_02865 [Candidatus Paceibacterota bacterium]
MISAIPSLSVVNSTVVLPSLEAVLAYDHPTLVARIEKKLGVSQEEAEQLFKDTKKFLYLCAISEESISPNETLDFGWHEFILFMRDYEKFCQDYFGELIYHRPRYLDDLPSNNEGSQRALDLAREVFGEELSENWDYPKLESAAGAPCGDSCGCQPACNTD